LNLNPQKTTDEQKLYTIPELSEELSVPDNTLRKYVNYFELPVERKSRKVYLTYKAVRTIKSILKLRHNGLPLPRIKSLLSILKKKDRLANQNQDNSELEIKTERQTKLPDFDDQKQEETSKIQPKSSSSLSQNKKTDSKISSNNFPENTTKTSFQEKENKEQASKPTVKQNYEVENSFRPKNLEDLEASPVNREEIKEEEKENTMTKSFLNGLVANVSRRLNGIKKASCFLADGKELAEKEKYLYHLKILLAGVRNLRDNWVENDRKQECKISSGTG